MAFYIIVIILLLFIVLFLSISIWHLIKKSIYLSDKEKELINFIIDIFVDYADDLGIQSKDQHEKISKELNNLRNKYFKNGKR